MKAPFSDDKEAKYSKRVSIIILAIFVLAGLIIFKLLLWYIEEDVIPRLYAMTSIAIDSSWTAISVRQ